MRNTLIKKAAAVIAAAAVAASMPVTALAVAGTTTTMDKYLVMESQANVPATTFTFTVAAGAHVDAVQGATLAQSKPEILAGVQPGNVTVGSAAFAVGDATQDAKQAGDTVTLAAGEKYAKKTVTVDFTGVNFPNPGVYRYVITENANTTPGITNDSATTRVIDVYVNSDNAGTLSIAGYALHRTNAVAYSSNANGDGSAAYDATEKDKGFQNRYTTSDLTFGKTVTGNQGDRSKYFKLTLSISGAQAGAKYAVDLSNAQANAGGSTNPSELTVGAGGTISQDFYLKDGQTIKVQGLTAVTKYTVVETIADSEGYKVSNTVTSGSSSPVQSNAKTTGEVTIGADDDVVNFVNDRKGFVPTDATTGIYLMIGAAVIALAGVAVVVIRRKRGSEA